MRIEIYWDDLIPAKQAELLALLGDNGNYDVFPLCTIELEGDESDVCGD